MGGKGATFIWPLCREPDELSDVGVVGIGFDAAFRAFPMTYIQLLASRWQALAEEIFARADRVHDADIREKLRGIAARYVRLVQRAEDQSGRWKVQR